MTPTEMFEALGLHEHNYAVIQWISDGADPSGLAAVAAANRGHFVLGLLCDYVRIRAVGGAVPDTLVDRIRLRIDEPLLSAFNTVHSS